MVQQRSERFVRVDGGWMQLWVCKWCTTPHLKSTLRIQQEITWLKRRHVAASSFFWEVREHDTSQPAENAQCFHGTGCTAICLGDAWDAASWWAWGLSLQGVLRFHEVSFRVKANVKGKKALLPAKSWMKISIKYSEDKRRPQAKEKVPSTSGHKSVFLNCFSQKAYGQLISGLQSGLVQVQNHRGWSMAPRNLRNHWVHFSRSLVRLAGWHLLLAGEGWHQTTSVETNTHQQKEHMR